SRRGGDAEGRAGRHRSARELLRCGRASASSLLDSLRSVNENAVLYALSTLAQTCAALAAFVGAVGLFRLQLLRADQNTAERNLRGLAARENLGVGSDLASLLPIEDIVNLVTNADPKQGAASKRALGTW